MNKQTCEFGIDCNKCTLRGMCSSYASYQCKVGYTDAMNDMKNFINNSINKEDFTNEK